MVRLAETCAKPEVIERHVSLAAEYNLKRGDTKHYLKDLRTVIAFLATIPDQIDKAKVALAGLRETLGPENSTLKKQIILFMQ